MSDINRLHVEGGSCWCDDGARREQALDVLYPDRCHETLLMNRTCVLPNAHNEPCRGSKERPGDPCHYCGSPTSKVGNGPGCSTCWTDLKGLPMADLKGILAHADLSVSPPRDDATVTRLSRAELLARKAELEAHIKGCCGAEVGLCQELAALKEVEFLLGGDEP